MKHSLLTLALILSFAGILFGQKTYIHAGSLIDGQNKNIQKEMTLIVEGNQIIDIQKGYQSAGASDQLIDLKSYTVMPGFIDLHVHIESQTSKTSYMNRFTLNEADIAYQAASYAETTLLAGFTTVRDLGGTGVNIALRKAIDQGIATGPRIFTAGKSLAVTGGHADPTNGFKKELMGNPGPREGVVNSPEEGRQAVRQRVKDGADVIKITATGGVLSLAKDGSAPQFTIEEIRAITETAADYGMHVAAHAHGAEGMKRAIKGGVKTIEHGTFMDDEVIALMKQYGAYYVPTITAGRTVADSAKVEGYYPSIVVPKALAVGPQIQDTFTKAYKAGVKIAFGTDAGVFVHGRNAIEFQLMVEGGMPAMEAIQSATKVAAEVLGKEKSLGTLEKGKLADIVAVKGDPIKNIELLQAIDFVMKDGKVYKDR
ncbi:amidohydrolase family protein [Cytophagales bacterium LB-30]|uniref:Amidohydrolase family protein n=1 Tax=Shiella aurantiaca TaxID=3058365 RepID=A0ABT8F208_9BACT|nr:amidohydrolase family protein [Shiella aurantiaca]MDN4164274.1 amidohydrolase family protein [Shiella aurantiaca]